MLCLFNIRVWKRTTSQQPDIICVKSSCCQPGKGVVGCGEYHWTSLFKWLLLYNRVVTNGQRLGISPGFYENVSFVVNKSYRIKERFLGCRLDFICYTRPCHDQKCDTQELEVGWKSTSRPLLSPWTSSQASFESQNWFQGLCLAPGMKEKDRPKRLGTTHKKRWSTWH